MKLEDIVRSELAPLLESRGFNAMRRRFRRERREFTDFLSIGKGQRWYQGKFCIELFTQPRLSLPLPENGVEPTTCWFRVKLAPDGLEDKWWPNEDLTDLDVAELRYLICVKAEAWFSLFPSIHGAFVERWEKLEADIREGSVWNKYGLTDARLAFVSALAHRIAGRHQNSREIAQLARELASPAATNFLGWVRDLESGAFDAEA